MMTLLLYYLEAATNTVPIPMQSYVYVHTY